MTGRNRKSGGRGWAKLGWNWACLLANGVQQSPTHRTQNDCRPVLEALRIHPYGLGMVTADRNASTCRCMVVSYCPLRIADPPPPIRLRSSFVALLRSRRSLSSFLPSTPSTPSLTPRLLNNLANHLCPEPSSVLPRFGLLFLFFYHTSLSTLYFFTLCTVHALSSLSCDLYTIY